MSKVYLCTDVVNKKTKKVETFYLLHEQLESILKFTSYCENENMLINTLPDVIKNFILNNSIRKSEKNFYLKNYKNSNPIDILYKFNEDLLFCNSMDVKELLDKNKLAYYNNNFYDNEEIYLFYSKLEELIKDNKIIDKINYNFYKKYDGDKNLEYINYKNFPLWKKIASCDNNIKISLDYVCNNISSKIELLLILKKILRKNLLNEDKCIKRRMSLSKKLEKDDLNYNGLCKKMINNYLLLKDDEKNVLKPYNFVHEDELVDENYNEADFISRYLDILNDENIEPDELFSYIDERKRYDKNKGKK